ncbi:hypothetical protein [Acidobacterium sp. S8]|uniref:hypothetical protein n=1 Tax=Acidobacterium sp. S8 TaxID=1641854 RepID=UPI00131CB777|nr:hypothetical protein [Acidobacterium sp. S8]
MTEKTDNSNKAEAIDHATPATMEAEKNPEPRKRRATKPRHFRKTAQTAIGEKYEAIVEKLADHASQGSVQHTKLLFDLGGVKEEVRASASPKRRRNAPSLGKMLLAAVEQRNKEKAANAAIAKQDTERAPR